MKNCLYEFYFLLTPDTEDDDIQSTTNYQQTYKVYFTVSLLISQFIFFIIIIIIIISLESQTPNLIPQPTHYSLWTNIFYALGLQHKQDSECIIIEV